MAKQAVAAQGPMFQRYLSKKAGAPKDLLFMQMAGFLEAFFEDAEIVARELCLEVESRGGVPMCGFPREKLTLYMPLLWGKGYAIAVCKRTEAEELQHTKDVI